MSRGNSSIDCNVCDCAFNLGSNNKCSLSYIKITKNGNATSIEGTDCANFKLKSDKGEF
ncbi:protein of unknown function [Desulfonispora thiosulfatigenes DSM 11270]|uniref:DUF1540 domain-containing protein n=1 Tax=Desulfonispora thiosulfatigenes DSM 11270 TaxID=656914 RepID=A0A1W1UK31_DESTI|nr:DUF1540 domain-containing protein [Desulfonispora thiosulfatigenes]SMB81373.1 protein of unknown function [Desulfonispora thiosulfatigenes DSM 11270]